MSFSTHSRILFSSEYFHYELFIHEKCSENQNDKFQEILSRPSIIDAEARYWAAVQRLRITDLVYNTEQRFVCENMIYCNTRCILSRQISLEAYDSAFVTIYFILIASPKTCFFKYKKPDFKNSNCCLQWTPNKACKNDSFPWPLVAPALSISMF
jgi:hypothetical protein